MAGPAPAVARTRQAVRSGLSELGSCSGAPDPTVCVNERTSARLRKPGGAVLAAVSGGPDSLALAAALAFEAPKAGVRAGAVIVDHCLQDGSGEVAVRTAAQCGALGLDPVEVLRVRVEAAGEGPEAAARRARYAALEDSRQRLGASHIFLGHTRDDQAEQVLLGLLRGAGARSLAGMARVRGPLIRPFLDVGREETESACAAMALDVWLDPHNDDERYARVRARALLAEVEERLGGGVRANLARTARLLREDSLALDEWAAAVHNLTIADLAPLPKAIRTRAVRRHLLEAGADGSALGSRHLDQVDQFITNWHGQGPVDVPGLLQIVRREGALVIETRRPVE